MSRVQSPGAAIPAPTTPAPAPRRVEVTEVAEKAPKVEKTAFLAEDAPRIDKPQAPEGYNPKIHKGLHRGDFTTDLVYAEFRALKYEAVAQRIRNEIEQMKKLGSSADQAKAKKLMAMQQRMAALAKELSSGSSPVDLSALLGAETAAALLK